MIEESGRVVAVEAGAVWVETLRKSTCGSCAANAGCGQGLMDKLGVSARRGHVRALSDLRLTVGDSVVIGVREDLLLRAALLVYLLPLLGLLAAAGLANGAGLGEPLVIIAGVLGLALTWFAVRQQSQRTATDPAMQPVVLRAMVLGSAA